MKIKTFILIILLVIFLIGCGEKQPLGEKSNPLKMYFVPSMEAGKVLSDGKQIAKLLEEKTGYHFKVAVPTSYASVIEAMGTKEADIAWLATFAYLLANNKFGAEVGLTTIRGGQDKYRGQFVTHVENNIDSLPDIQDKIIAYTDAASTSGYIYPSSVLKQKGIKPAKHFFAGGHPQAIIAVYEGNADVGCTFWSPSDNNKPRDARISVLETYPDVLKKIRIIGYTEWIPNDTVTFRKNLPSEIKDNIIKALIEISQTKKGKKILKDLYDIDGFVKAKNSDYDVVRTTLKTLNVDAGEFIK